MLSIQRLSQPLQRTYVIALLDIVARALVETSQIDETIQQETQQFPVGFRIMMNIFATDLGFVLEVNAKQQWHIIPLKTALSQKIDLAITFKHLHYAFLVLSFQESTAQAFAHNRMFVDGDLASAIRFVRCLNQLETIILPKFIAKLAVKEYPKQLTLGKKLNLAQRIYRQVAQSYLKGK